MDDAERVRLVTRAVREADREFQQSGGSSRHWVRECFLPCLEEEGLAVLANDLVSGDQDIVDVEAPAEPHAPDGEVTPVPVRVPRAVGEREELLGVPDDVAHPTSLPHDAGRESRYADAWLEAVASGRYTEELDEDHRDLARELLATRRRLAEVLGD
jgi:hypothetical protein